ncbi:MAG: hypothetical protein QXV82_09335 [Ignisphaera sp.]
MSNRVGLIHVPRLQYRKPRITEYGIYIDGIQYIGTVSTSSDAWVQDTYASLGCPNELLTDNLIFYNAQNERNATQTRYGKGICCNIAGTLYSDAFSNQTPYQDNYQSSCLYVKRVQNLEGDFSVTGYFKSFYSGYTVTISARQILRLGFPVGKANEVKYTESGTAFATSSTTFVDDTYAVLSFEVPTNMIAIIIYNTMGRITTSGSSIGIRTCVNINDSDVSQSISQQSWHYDNYPYNCKSIYATTLTAGSYTIKGRVCSVAGATIRVNYRVLAVILLKPSLFTVYSQYSDVLRTTNSTTWVNDPDIGLSFSIPSTYLYFVFYNASNRNNDPEYSTGKYIGLEIDGVMPEANSLGNSGTASNYPNSVFTMYSGYLSSGNHTIQPKFKSLDGQNVSIRDRQFIVCLMNAMLTPYPP